MHHDLTLRAARAGVHVLCEKPMAMTTADCEAMIRACQDANVLLMIAYRLHFEEATLRAIELVRGGDIGEPLFVSSVLGHQARPGDIRTRADAGGGALFDMGIYCLNAARNIFGEEPIEVSAMASGGDERFRGVDATTAALLRFPGGRLAQFTASQGSADVDFFRVVGSKGELRVEPAFAYSHDIVHHLVVEGRTRTVLFSERDQFGPELASFARCIQEGTEPEPSGEEGLLDVRVLEAIARSAAKGRPVTLAPYVRRRRPTMSQEIRMPKIAGQKTVHAPAPSR
jgi:predicted dehydrogenase